MVRQRAGISMHWIEILPDGVLRASRFCIGMVPVPGCQMHGWYCCRMILRLAGLEPAPTLVYQLVFFSLPYSSLCLLEYLFFL